MKIYEVEANEIKNKVCTVTLNDLKVDERFGLPYSKCTGKIMDVRGSIIVMDVTKIGKFDITKYGGGESRRVFKIDEIIDIEILENNAEVTPQ